MEAARGRVARAAVGEHGYAMAALLVALGVMGVMLTVLLPAWSTQAKREREAELVFRGEQYARAIRLFGQRYPNALPPNVDVLVQQRFLRKKYKDPITGGDFVVVAPGAALPGTEGQPAGARGGTPAGGPASTPGRGAATAQQGGRGRAGGPAFGVTTGVAGVASSSTDNSLRVYNGRTKYNEWIFMPVQGSTAAGIGGAQGTTQPGLPPGRGGRGTTAPGSGAGGAGRAGPGAGGRGQLLPLPGSGRGGP